MQFTRETSESHLVRAWEPGRVRIGEQWFTGPIILSRDRIIEDWAVTNPVQVVLANLEAAIDQQPEIILLGTGDRLVWPDAPLMSELAALRIGLEIMSTPAACRTFNVLVHEHRRVVAALFNGTGSFSG